MEKLAQHGSARVIDVLTEPLVFDGVKPYDRIREVMRAVADENDLIPGR